MNALRCEIAVVGGGISGCALAGALLDAGFDVRVVERAGAPAPFDASQWDPRVYAIAPGSVRLLHALGVWDAVRACRAAPIRQMRVWDRDPARALRFDAPAPQAAELGWIVEHRLLADLLWQRLPAGRIHARAALRHVEFCDAHVALHLDDGTQLHAQLAIGAEGAESALREACGIDTVGWSYASTAVVCHLHSHEPHRGVALQRFLPSGPVALLPLPDGRRSLVWSTTEADARALLDLDDETFCAHLREAMQDTAGVLTQPTPRLGFGLRLLHARRYVASRCALIGDSAHVIHPLAGQGLNLGLGDAAQLACDLIEARTRGRDWSGLRTLERYERARQSENLEMLALTDALGRAYALDLPGWRALLSAGLRAVDRLGPLKTQLAARARGTS